MRLEYLKGENDQFENKIKELKQQINELPLEL